MRIVAGTARGRKLTAPAGAATRPTADRVREAVFNALYSLGDLIDGARVVDLFAGTGALGLEARSRGAAEVTFVERDARALRTLAANLDATGLAGPECEVVRADVLAWLRRGSLDPVDVAFADPPYDFAGWADLLAAIPAAVVVIESDRDVIGELGDGAPWGVLWHRRYGGTVVTIVRRLPST